MNAPRPLSANSRPRLLWLPLALVLLALALRIAKGTEAGKDLLPNFSPWMALVFTGTALFPRAFPWWGCVAALLAVDLLSQSRVLLEIPLTMAVIYGCFALAALWAAKLRGRAGGLGIIGGTLACGLIFYLVTNTLAWLTLPEYAKTLAGWAQALTTGLPGFPPTWTFLRNSLLSDAGFATLLVLAYNTEAASRRSFKIQVFSFKPRSEPVTLET